MPIARLPHSETWYEVEGSGPPLVLIHGMGGDRTLWDAQVAGLRDRFRIVRYDTLGHGRSEKIPGPWRFSQFARQADELVAHLEIPRAIICGFSLGGSIAQSIAIEYPRRAAALMVVASVCARTPTELEGIALRVKQVAEGGPAAVVDGAMKRWFSESYARAHPEMIDYWRRKLLSNDRAPYLNAYTLYSEVDKQLLDQLGRIDTPTLIVTGDADIGQSPRMAREMAQRIRGAEVEIFPGIPHMLPVEAADALNDAIAGFVTRRKIEV